MNFFAKAFSLSAMLATVTWFFWNPKGWIFQWEPIVVFLFALAGFVKAEKTGESSSSKPHPNDIVLFRNFLEVLPSTTFIELLKQHDFLLDFEPDTFTPLTTFLYEWDNAEHEFQNKDLESLKKALLITTEDFCSKISKYTSRNKSGFYSVRVDHLKYENEHEARFRKEASIIDDASDKFILTHQNLVREGRRLCNLST